MAKYPRGLCFILTLWLVLSRPSAAGRTGSPNPSPGWGEQASQYEQRAHELRKLGDYPALESLYREAEQHAAAAHQVLSRINYTTALGNTYVFMYRYTEAIDTYRRAENMAERSQNWEAAGAVAPGLSNIFYFLGDWSAARAVVERGLRNAARLSAPPYYKAELMLQYARLQAGLGDNIASALEAIDSAWAQSDEALNEVKVEAAAWDLIGEESLRREEWSQAEDALGRGLWLRRLRLPRDLVFSYWRLGELRLAQATQAASGSRPCNDALAQADHFTSLAIVQARESGNQLGSGSLIHQRALIRQAQGRTEEALKDFAAAARIADRWRLVVPAVGSSRTVATEYVEGQVFRDFAEAAAKQAMRTQQPQWLETGFLADELNRAASLRQTQQLAEVWREKLPDEYWADLARLRTEESRHPGEKDPTALAQSLHVKLTKMEAAAGLGSSRLGDESPASVSGIQRRLRPTELLLSFYTGRDNSYLWAMTRDSLHVYRLPGAERLAFDGARFREAVVGRHPEAGELGAELYRELFGSLSARESGQTSWLLSLDSLFDIPFAALTDTTTESQRSYLVEHHSIQLVPGALLLDSRRPAQGKTGSYLGVADPVYNAADERFANNSWLRSFGKTDVPGQLNRLVASSDEVARSAEAWQGQAHGTTTVLTGVQASREGFLRAISTSVPATIHLATHVLTSQGAPEEDSESGSASHDQAVLAFSLGSQGRPELLSSAEIASLHVPGSLVVMTGCASGTGDVKAGAGLLGLTRAWLIAGANAVIATGWATEDSQGELLPALFRDRGDYTTAEALRRSQVEMIHSRTWQADPAYWASYQVTGGVR